MARREPGEPRVDGRVDRTIHRLDTFCIALSGDVRYYSNMDTPSARLRHLRENQGIGSASALARGLGVPEVTYRAHESGVRGFGEKHARRYAEFLGANWVWLLTGTGEPFGQSSPSIGAAQAKLPGSAKRSPGDWRAPRTANTDLPVYASAEGGPSGMLIAFEAVDWIARPEPLLNARDAFAVYVVGDAMAPRFEQGDLVLVHPSRPVRREDDILLIGEQVDAASAALIRRLVQLSESAWTVRQYDPQRDEDLRRTDWPHVHAILGRFSRP